MSETVLGTRNADARTHIDRLNPERKNEMTPEQFAELRDLLLQIVEMGKPGAELSRLYLEQMKAQEAAKVPAEEPPPAA